MLPSRLKKDDNRKVNKSLYAMKVDGMAIIELPEMKYIHAVGKGARDIYKMFDYHAPWTLGRIANRLKYHTVRELGKNYRRMPLEMEWMNMNLKNAEGLNEYEYKAMMWVPEYITEEIYENTIIDIQKRLGKLSFIVECESLTEGTCAQALHFGAYNQIDQTVEKMKSFIEKNGYTSQGNHREIYMNHPHCNPPDKLQIIIRQQVATMSDTR